MSNELRFWNYKKMANTLFSDDAYIYEKIIRSIINDTDTLEAQVGAEVLGPFLLGFCQFINEYVRNNNVEKIFFLSRDAAIIKRAYDILYSEESIESAYIYVSRHSILIPTLYKTKTYEDIVNVLIPFLHEDSINYLLKLCGFDISEGILNEIGVTGLEKVYELDKIQRNILYAYIKKEKQNEYEKSYKNVKAYLEAENFTGRIVIVDIGWNGTIQKGLEQYTDIDTIIDGLYLGVKDFFDFTRDIVDRMHGFVFAPGKNREYAMMEKFTAEGMDVLFSKPDEGTVLEYRKISDRIVPIIDKSEYGRYEATFVLEIQRYALQFISIVKREGMHLKHKMPPDLIMTSYSLFAVYPSLKILKPFSKIKISDGSAFKKLVPVHSLPFYLIHPIDFKREFSFNICKIWFLKWLIKIPLPYYRILVFIYDRGYKSTLDRLNEKSGNGKASER